MSSRIPSLLLPLCLLSAVALNVYPLLDPTGVYGSYLSKLDKKTPPVAAVALAAADGVYPWSEPKAPEPPPAPEPLPEPEPEPEPEEPVSPFTTVDASYFDDALFIGDSHTDGLNAKTSRPSVCNAEEVCLVHRAIAKDFLPRLKAALVDERKAAGLVPVELRLDEAAAEIIPGTSATERDFDTEFLDYILAVAVVDDLDAAIAHVQQHSTHHSDCIVTENKDAAARFVDEVDSAAVYVNVSTRFTDGGEFGLGCEMGISTQKLHARGPMGLDELSTYKYVITGSGQVR